MVFKVGDKVKAVNASYGWGSVTKGEVGKVTLICGGITDCDYLVDFKSQKEWEASESDLELVEPKKTKNQRITELEKRVASLLERVEVLENGPKTMRDTLNELEPLFTEPSTNQEVQHQTIQCAVAKSPNQQRAEIIEKAKKFVDETVAYGRSSNRYKSEGNSTYRSNFYDVDFFVKGNKVTAVIYWLRGNVTRVEKPEHVGRAKCAPGDVFNEHIGKAIALGRALGLDVSEFEQAVQPTEFVVGQIIANICGKKAEETVRVENNQAYDKYGMFWPIESLTEWNECKIINDTNAIYEEENK